MAETGVLFALFAVIWIAVGVGVFWRQGTPDRAWHRIQGLPLVLRALVWLLFLPVMVGLWLWASAWPRLVRLVLVLGLAAWNLLVFVPVALTGARP
jgi:hypothetical protein